MYQIKHSISIRDIPQSYQHRTLLQLHVGHALIFIPWVLSIRFYMYPMAAYIIVGSCHTVKESVFGCISRDLLCIHISTATSAALFHLTSPSIVLGIHVYHNTFEAPTLTLMSPSHDPTIISLANKYQASFILRINHGLPFPYHLHLPNLLIMLLLLVADNHLACFLTTP